MLAPGTAKRFHSHLGILEKITYKKKIKAWVKLSLEEYYQHAATINREKGETAQQKTIYNPGVFYWKERCEVLDLPYSLTPSELLAYELYDIYTQKGLQEREIYKDMLYIKEMHINKIAAKEFRKRPAWTVTENKNIRIDDYL